MLQALFHAWERRLAAVTTDRVVRPLEWGLDWIPRHDGQSDAAPATIVGDWVSHVMADTDAFFTPAPATAYSLGPASPDGERALTFPSAFETPHPENNVVHARLFPARNAGHAHTLRQAQGAAAVLVLPQWNANANGHVDLDMLRDLWRPISPAWYLERMRDRQTLLVYAKYDLTFPVDLSEDLVRQFRECDVPHQVTVLHCGHYTSGRAPFKFIDGWVLSRFLKRALMPRSG